MGKYSSISRDAIRLPDGSLSVSRFLAACDEIDRKPKQVAFRKSGKAHRGLIMPDDHGGYLVAACSCPGSQNGRLTHGAQITGETWDKANCGN